MFKNEQNPTYMLHAVGRYMPPSQGIHHSRNPDGTFGEYMHYVCNPDSILSDSIVAVMDSILYALEEKTGIQTMVVAITDIEGGDCFDFAY